MADNTHTLRDFWRILSRPVPAVFVQAAGRARDKSLPVLLAMAVLGPLVYIAGCIPFSTPLDLSALVISIIFFPVLYLFWVFSIYFLSRKLFHRSKNNYEKLFYVNAFIFAIAMIQIVLLALVPGVGVHLQWLGYIYLLVVTALALRAITHLGVWQSLLVALISTVIAVVGSQSFILFSLILLDTVPRVF